MSEKQPINIFQRNVQPLKLLLILLLITLLLIPATMVQGIIEERRDRQQTAMAAVNDQWGNAQAVTGPVLVLPYKQVTQVNNEAHTEVLYAYLLPDQLQVSGKLHPELLRRGIYKTAVYDSELSLKGSFKTTDLTALGLRPENILLDKVSLSIGLSDPRGISSEVKMNWEHGNYNFVPGVVNKDLYASGILSNVPVTIQGDNLVASDFNIAFSLKGSQQLYFSPVGSNTQVSLESDTLEPSYDGAFLPNHKTGSRASEGFSATWQVLQLNRNFPPSWKGDAYHIQQSDFGVRLMTPIDTYQQTTRSAKYAILIIGLTFLVFYFLEQFLQQGVHPFQYCLIGLALIVFYTLLLSISEQTNFDVAYLVAAIMTVGLITAFAGSLFKRLAATMVVGSALTFLYGFIYVILQSEDNALIMGSLGLFVILAILMFLSRKMRFDAPGTRTPAAIDTHPSM
ncbi:inner membrane protein [Chitinophaga costaii]|uniref:Inner membrane protein n=1 Tax=Chitinophaga costaii TaxID=1335309 RepID=A0A1C4DVY7_9BACT|nr:cell envelope integrity protein CreD [Chitinophaga costaii]PUZ27829.1 cell envelope integrity protein CreD [Chitinophaga costaii]SCC35523.1 inner membrane protein [Chitinophaga costaii]